MRKRAAALGLATAFLYAGCSTGGNETGPATPTPGAKQVSEIIVRNILGAKIDLGSDPHTYTPAMKTGEIAAGATATATCIIFNEDDPRESDLFIIDNQGGKGYVSYLAGGGKDEEPVPRFTPGIEELKNLPPCGDSPTDA